MMLAALVDVVVAEDDCYYGGNVVKGRGEGGEGVGGDAFSGRYCSVGLHPDHH